MKVEGIPSTIDTSRTLSLVKNSKNPTSYLTILKEESGETDEELSELLDMNVKTFRMKKAPRKVSEKKAVYIEPSLLERTIMLISLFRHGKDVFGTIEKFKKWLEQENFYFGKKTPRTYMDTVSGIKFIDDSLTAMEYGDNA